MKITKHSQIRMKQRGISETMINLVWFFGDPYKGTDKFILSSQKLRDLHSTSQSILNDLNRV